jgi:hypothetical protein
LLAERARGDDPQPPIHAFQVEHVCARQLPHLLLLPVLRQAYAAFLQEANREHLVTGAIYRDSTNTKLEVSSRENMFAMLLNSRKMLVILGTVPKGKVRSTSYLSIAQKGIMYELFSHV